MSFEDDVAAAKASGRPFRIAISKDAKAVVFLTAEEIAQAKIDRAAAVAKQQAQAAERAALFSAATALDPLASPYSQPELNAKVEALISYLRLRHPEDTR